MKRQLDENLQELTDSFAKIEDFTKSADDLAQNYNFVLKISDQISNQLTNFEAQKSRVVTLEQNFNRMIALSNTIDDRILSLNTTKDDLQSM